MRQLKNIMSTGCFFLCLGGWVYSGQAIGADGVEGARETAQTSRGGRGRGSPLHTAALRRHPMEHQVAQAVEPAAGVEAPATKPATTESSTNLNSAVVNVGVDGMVEQFNAQGLDINTALHFLSLQSKRNIIASKDVKGTVTANLYNVTFTEALDSLLKPNGFDYVVQGNFIYVYTADELDKIRKRDLKTANRIFRLKYMTAADASTLLKPLLSSSGLMALSAPAISGLPSGTSDMGGMSNSNDDVVVINDYPENLANIDKALKVLDVRPKQVLIESTILRASLNEDNALGVDFISLSGVDLSGLTGAKFTTNTAGTSTSSTDTTGTSTGTQLFGPGGIVNNFAKQNETNVGTDFASTVPAGRPLGRRPLQ